jgi:prepilin-type N-terminal cleavage/methylation domain-containing protein
MSYVIAGTGSKGLRKERKSSGFTFIELMVAMAMFLSLAVRPSHCFNATPTFSVISKAKWRSMCPCATLWH